MTMPILSNISVVVAFAAAGALISFAAYRRAAKRKANHVRAELRAEQQLLCAAIESLRTTIDMAKQSWSAGADAAITGTGELPQWLQELDFELSELELSRSQLPAGDSDSEPLSDIDVDIKLVDVLALSLRVNTLADQYRDSISDLEAECETVDDDAEAPAPQYSISKSTGGKATAPIAESVV
jgi:hypothetical protein